jgi:hypothetical protein
VTDATVSAYLQSDDGSVTYYFEYGKTTGYGARTADVTVATGQGGQTYSQVISGLSPGTTYHYRVRARNSSGERVGDDLTFTTKRDSDGDGVTDERDVCPKDAANTQNGCPAWPGGFAWNGDWGGGDWIGSLRENKLRVSGFGCSRQFRSDPTQECKIVAVLSVSRDTRKKLGLPDTVLARESKVFNRGSNYFRMPVSKKVRATAKRVKRLPVIVRVSATKDGYTQRFIAKFVLSDNPGDGSNSQKLVKFSTTYPRGQHVHEFRADGTSVIEVGLKP